MSLRANQQTVSQNILLNGVGLHTGVAAQISIEPAPEGTGIRFQRTDLEGQPIIKADVDNVTDTARSTTLSQNGASISTVEHLMAAFAGAGVDNALVKVDAAEIPIMDGSAFPFLEAILKVGVQQQAAVKEYYKIPENIQFKDEKTGISLLAVPADDFQITTMVDFNSPVIGTQFATLSKIEDFETEIAKSRTFCFFHELEILLAQNLIKGGDLDNAIVIVDKEATASSLEKLSQIFDKKEIKVEQGYLNNTILRYPNEIARHKLLDVLGDLMLCGYSLQANIIATKPGHSSNVAFAKQIKDYIKKNKGLEDIPKYDPSQAPVYDIHHIEKVLPHKYPFLLVDKIIELSENHVVGIKNVTYNEPFFTGHFPGNPVMPGVLQIEAMAQVGGILALSIMPENEKGYDTYFLKIDKVKFKQKVIPGDTLIIKLELLAPIRRGICEMKAMAFVGNKLITEAELMAQIVARS